jgi:hypothetical protein
MPCYLFTYHAYGTWLPDRKQGYVERKRGILPTDMTEAARYRTSMKETVAEFRSATQLSAIGGIIDSQTKQKFEAYYIATESTHIHALVGWRDERTWLHMRSIIKSSIKEPVASGSRIRSILTIWSRFICRNIAVGNGVRSVGSSCDRGPAPEGVALRLLHH